MKIKKLLLGVAATVATLLFTIKLVSADTLPVYDMSEWQGPKTEQQFQNVKSEVSGLLFRRQYGSNYIDKQVNNYTQLADKVGVPYGEYAYARFVSASDARQEAKDFYNRSDKNAKFYALDYEEPCVIHGSSQDAVKAWLSEMRSLTNKKIIFYSYRKFSDIYAGQAVLNQFDGFWLAAYQSNLPQPQNYDLWQHRDDQPSLALGLSLDSSLVMTDKHPVSYWFGNTAKVINKKLNNDDRHDGFTVGQTVTLKQSAVDWYVPRVGINPSAKGQTYTIKDTKKIVLSRSNQAVLLYKGNTAIGWALAQDVQNYDVPKTSTTLVSGTFNDDGYTINRENGTFTAKTALRVFAYPGVKPTGATYYPGESVKYDGWYRRGNYIYISYVNYAGYHHYIAVRENGVALGDFK
ncbi:hypothetical protein FC19_GL001426 [Liquorilactobacillus aquaticus DSM 21051]|uniref:SH3b domain-containing protein n=1 Tax=Liquorilactobacillus aquaticus DSM 21051 TaxID=1423725 RepID=A0A0R2CXG5_9LACO|nr:GH25 family lysozyme [Liquorilactobacillus aquaticus]KRM95946.1 hypothetical protein FC19_GL001426 [Liquorilactobacillus aquaticus DSM 21051]